jgi:parallel beta-helix repeat protein
MVFFVVLVINVAYNQRNLLANITDPNLIVSEQQLPGYDWEEAKEKLITTQPTLDNIGAKQVAEGTTRYEIGAGDTIALLAQKYGVEESAITLESDTWKIGERIQFQLPFKNYQAYRQALPPMSTTGSGAQITYRSEINAITVAGNMAIVDIPTIHRVINNEDVLSDEGDGVYLLKVNLELKRHAVLLIEGPQVSWLKLQSNQQGAVRIFGDSANIGISKTKVTSWDPDLNDFDHEINDGRAHIRVNNGRMDIVDSEMAYLGQPKLRNSGGGVYGLSWRVENSSRYERELTTGSFENNEIHNNYMGFYSFGATGMTLRNNRVYNNIEYGLDPHDDTNNLIVENNEVFGNGNHGIIFSRRCVNNIIRNNRSYDNALHGIMLDRESNNNSIYNNYIEGNVDGIALWRSDLNAIYNNQIVDNRRGIRLNRRSADNVIYDNQLLTSAQYGVYLYEESRANWFFNNTLQDNHIGFYVRALSNYIFDNTVTGGESAIYLNQESSGNQIARNQLTGSTTGIYLKTAADELIVDNIFQNNLENIRYTEEWSSDDLSQSSSSYLARFRRYFAVTRLWAQAEESAAAE